VAAVLHSLILYASSVDQNFDDWCSGFGYSSDSIKALNVYQACIENAKQLRHIFTRAELARLAEILQDY
jgi:hypothetical protein